jgi:hypothetical protein
MRLEGRVLRPQARAGGHVAAPFALDSSEGCACACQFSVWRSLGRDRHSAIHPHRMLLPRSLKGLSSPTSIAQDPPHLSFSGL